MENVEKRRTNHSLRGEVLRNEEVQVHHPSKRPLTGCFVGEKEEKKTRFNKGGAVAGGAKEDWWDYSVPHSDRRWLPVPEEKLPGKVSNTRGKGLDIACVKRGGEEGSW